MWMDTTLVELGACIRYSGTSHRGLREEVGARGGLVGFCLHYRALLLFLAWRCGRYPAHGLSIFGVGMIVGGLALVKDIGVVVSCKAEDLRVAKENNMRTVFVCRSWKPHQSHRDLNVAELKLVASYADFVVCNSLQNTRGITKPST
ncbi:hypothetical protein QBC41DRAFT_321985 [Cercophora samala]|uniref:Uncharacterized protein n=1 Tax=Cercophora samala TaxID=330535 RepID=A0AA40DC90_9PEZI|nr:hypothetical protein QBC41DRAFT_321985 [Cercophora samala]